MKYYTLDRDDDVSGISGVGRIAYAIELTRGVLLVWDTRWVTVDWRPDMDVLDAIHGHNGATRITPMAADSAAADRARELLRRVAPSALATVAEAKALLAA